KANEVAEKRRIGLDRVETGWILLAVALALTGYAAFWIFVRLRWVVLAHGVVLPMGCVFLTMIALLGTRASMKFADLAGAVANVTMSAGRNRAMPKPCEWPGAPPEVRARQHFPETLLWRPELITDDQGRASLDLARADSITTWRLTASAVSADGLLG